ncbi:MAG: hypothetical protein K2G44_00705 [Clostridia bacterium]|nr:hypothetical protein [Clostridia bacterium]
MKGKFKAFAALACAAVCAVSMTACGGAGGTDAGKSEQLGKPAEVTSLGYGDRTKESFVAFKGKVEEFAATFADRAYKAREEKDNFTVSPVSVYSALSLAAECASGETRSEILSALGVSYEQLKENYPMLYRALNVEHKPENEITGMVKLGNSIWLDERLDYKQPCIDALSQHYYAYSYSADFAYKNAEANQAVRAFVKEQTKGLIDQDFQLSKDTAFALINTLYLKTIWNNGGDDLFFTTENYTFGNADGTTKQTKLLLGDFKRGRAYEGETYSTFYTSTFDGYKIKFILPKDGYTVDDVFTAENIAEVNAVTDYRPYDGDTQTEYYTRCLFPEYKCKYDEDVKEILQEKFGINLLFDDIKCDYSAITNTPCVCTKVQHVTDLTVDKKGIEGAAVTIIANDATSPAPDEKKEVREDFILDRAFGFIITTWDNFTLFSGVVNGI